MYKFIIDVETPDKPNLIRRLSALKSTINCTDGGMYHMDKNYSQVHLTSELTEDEVDHWLWATKGVEYVAVVEIEKEKANCGYCGCTEPLVEDGTGSWPYCPSCGGV